MQDSEINSNYESNLISVIIPNYNGEKYLSNCIQSIINQKYRNLDIIIIDDGSTDSSLSIIKDYAKIDNRIRVFELDNNGVSYARNFGINKARGSYLAFVDSDDWIDSNMYYEMINSIKTNCSDASLCSYIKEYENEKKCEKENFISNKDMLYKKNDIIRYIIKGMIGSKKKGDIPTMGAVWRCIFNRNIIENNRIRFDEDVQIGEDLLFCLDYFINCESISLINKGFYHYLINDFSSLHKYREDMWENQLKLYYKLDEFIINKKILNVEKRMQNRILKGAFDSISNICKSQNKSNIKKQIKDIKNILRNERTIEALSNSSFESNKYKILKLNKSIPIFIIFKINNLIGQVKKQIKRRYIIIN